MYAKTFVFMVIIIDIYWIIFYQVYLLQWITTLYLFLFLKMLVLWNYGDFIVSWCINSTSLSGSEQLYYGWISGVLLERAGIIFVIYWSNVCEISIRKEIIPNPPFQYSRTVLVLLTNHQSMLIILNMTIKMDFGDIREA